jgi:hypothetical protein
LEPITILAATKNLFQTCEFFQIFTKMTFCMCVFFQRNYSNRHPICDSATQTDCTEFMSEEELATAHELGLNWGGQVPDRLLHDIRALKHEEEEAVQRFREGFLLALKGKQRMLIEAYERDRAGRHKYERGANTFPHHLHQQQQLQQPQAMEEQQFSLNLIPRHRLVYQNFVF